MSNGAFLLLVRVAFAVLFALTVASAQAGLTGTWRVEKPIQLYLGCCAASQMTFDLKVDGDKLTGTAHLGDHPGDSPISDGFIDGNLVSFMATSKIWSTSGFARVSFEGTIDGEILKLTTTTGWLVADRIVMSSQTYEVEAKKVVAVRR